MARACGSATGWTRGCGPHLFVPPQQLPGVATDHRCPGAELRAGLHLLDLLILHAVEASLGSPGPRRGPGRRRSQARSTPPNSAERRRDLPGRDRQLTRSRVGPGGALRKARPPPPATGADERLRPSPAHAGAGTRHPGAAPAAARGQLPLEAGDHQRLEPVQQPGRVSGLPRHATRFANSSALIQCRSRPGSGNRRHAPCPLPTPRAPSHRQPRPLPPVPAAGSLARRRCSGRASRARSTTSSASAGMPVAKETLHLS